MTYYAGSHTRGGRTEPSKRSAEYFTPEASIRRVEKRIARFQEEMANAAPELVPDYQKLITNEKRALDFYRGLLSR